MGAVAKSYMRKGFLIYEEMRKYLVKVCFLFISKYGTATKRSITQRLCHLMEHH